MTTPVINPYRHAATGPANAVDVLAVSTYHSASDDTSYTTATHTPAANTDALAVVLQPVVGNTLNHSFSDCTWDEGTPVSFQTLANFQLTTTTDQSDFANNWIGVLTAANANLGTGQTITVTLSGNVATGIGITVYDLRFVDQADPGGAVSDDEWNDADVATWPDVAALSLTTQRDKSLVIGAAGSDRRNGVSNPISLHGDASAGWTERVDVQIGTLTSEPNIWNGEISKATAGQVDLRLTPSSSNGFGMAMAEIKAAL